MRKSDEPAFDDLLASVEPDLRAVARRLRDLILEVHFNSTEVIQVDDRTASYGFGPEWMSEGYAYLSPKRNWVNLGFYRGADLPDPEGVLEGSGVRRHVKVLTLETANDPVLRDLIRSAVQERRNAEGLG